MLIFIRSDHHLLMFSLSPLGLSFVAASSRHPCLEHPLRVSLASLESISCPIISCQIAPAIFVYCSSYVSHFWPPFILSPSPPKSSQLLPGQPCTLCSNKGSHIFAAQSSFLRLSLVSVHQSHYYFPSCFS